MAPLGCRTWTPRGITPVFYQRGRSHQKISCLEALVVSPSRRRLHFYFRLHPRRNLNTVLVLEFLTHLLRQRRGRLVVVWDRLSTHRGGQGHQFRVHPRRLRLEYFPPYAPELNPIEYTWAWLKKNPLAHRAFTERATLKAAAQRSGRSIQSKQPLLRSFLQHSPLPLRLK